MVGVYLTDTLWFTKAQTKITKHKYTTILSTSHLIFVIICDSLLVLFVVTYIYIYTTKQTNYVINLKTSPKGRINKLFQALSFSFILLVFLLYNKYCKTIIYIIKSIYNKSHIFLPSSRKSANLHLCCIELMNH